MWTALRLGTCALLAVALVAGLVPLAPVALAEEAVEVVEEVDVGEAQADDGEAPAGQPGDDDAVVVLDEETILDGLRQVAEEDMAADAEAEGDGLEAQSASASNPRIVADPYRMQSCQVVTWDCVWFGSYPQSEVTSSDAEYASLRSTAWDAGGDATVDGVRYRRIAKADTTYDDYFGSADYRYFRYEPIKWRVLEVSGGRVLVVADVALDDQRYNKNDANVTWETSSIRSWLNGYGPASNQPGEDFTSRNFMDTAFSAGEQGAILDTRVANADNLEYGTPGGNDTTDKVFLLSESEVYGVGATAYGFANEYDIKDEAKRCKASNFAHAMGAWGNCWWWLRSPGHRANYAAFVRGDGDVRRSGDEVNFHDDAVRPALNLNLSSPYVTAAGTVSSDGAVDEQVPSVHSTTLKLGADATGSVKNQDAHKFFPANFSAKLALVPVQLAKETDQRDGSVTYKLGIGMGRKDVLDSETTWNQYKANVQAYASGAATGAILKYAADGGLTGVCATDGFKAMPKLGFTGYAEVKFSKGGEVLSTAGSVVAKADWKAKADWQFWTPIGPTYIGLSGGANAKLSGKPGFDWQGREPTFDGSLSVTPNIALEGGYGISGAATIGVQGSAEVPIQVAPPTKGEFGAKASLHAYLVFVIDWTHELKQFKTTLWDTTKDAAGTQSVEAQSASDGAAGTLGEVDRSYAERTTAWAGDVTGGGDLAVQADAADPLSTQGTGALKALQRSVMPNTIPLMAEVGGTRVMVFQQNDPSRTTLNSSRLMYSVLEDGVWGEPRAVWDTGTLDAYADLRVAGGDLYVAWQKERATLTGDVASDADGVLAELAANSEIAIARFDSQSGAFVGQRYVTDNDVLDMMPSLAEGAGGPQVAFARNAANALDQGSGGTQVVLAAREGSAWSESVLATEDEYVSSVSAGVANGEAEVAYATIDRGATGSVRLARAGSTVSDDGEQPTALQWQGGRLWWTSQGVVSVFDPAAGATSTLNAQILEDEDAAPPAAVVGDNARVLTTTSGTTLVWTESDPEAAASRVCSAVVLDDGSLSDAVELCRVDAGIAASDVVPDGDGYAVLANVFDAEGTHSLAYSGVDPTGSLQTMGASAYRADDGTTQLTYGFTNSSERPVDGYVVTVYDGDAVVGRRSIDETVAPGADVVGELSFPLGPDPQALRVEVSSAEVGDERPAAGCEATVETDQTLAAKDGQAQGGGTDDPGSGGGSGSPVVPARPSTPSTPAQPVAPKIAKGGTYSVGGMAYRVTSVATATKAGAVTLTRAKNAKKVTVPASVRLADGRDYSVTAVAKGSFKKLKKLRTAVLGKNVAKVAKGAFSSTPKLRTVTVKTKRLGKKASVKGMLKGSKVTGTVTVKVPKAKRKAYGKVFTKKNLASPKKVVVK